MDMETMAFQLLILPTGRAGKLQECVSNRGAELQYSDQVLEDDIPTRINQAIYVLSNHEGADKSVDYFFAFTKGIKSIHSFNDPEGLVALRDCDYSYSIFGTSDQELIDNGVPAFTDKAMNKFAETHNAIYILNEVRLFTFNSGIIPIIVDGYIQTIHDYKRDDLRTYTVYELKDAVVKALMELDSLNSHIQHSCGMKDLALQAFNKQNKEWLDNNFPEN